MATPDTIYVRFLESSTVKMVASEALPFEGVGPHLKAIKTDDVLSDKTPWDDVNFEAGETLRGWVSACPDKNTWLFVCGCAEYALVPRDKVEVCMQGDNPILDGRVSPK